MSPLPLPLWLDAWGVNKVSVSQIAAAPAIEDFTTASDEKIWEALERIAAKSQFDLSDLRLGNGHHQPLT